MKKLSAVLSTVLLIIFSTVNVAASYDYSVVEAEFCIPDEFSVIYDEENLSETEAFRFIDANNSVVLSCYRIENTFESSSLSSDMTEMIEYYFNNVSAFDNSDFTFESVQTYYANGLNDGIMFEGTVQKSGNVVPVEAYVFYTTGNIYGFEFLIYNESGRSYINEIVNSLYITDYDSKTGAESEDDFEGVFQFVFLILSLIAAIVSTVLKSKKDKIKKESTAEKEQQSTVKTTAIKPLLKKYELNGKAVNSINERVIIGKADDNFAQKELERERKERKNMFD